jgi:hypothetical protein
VQVDGKQLRRSHGRRLGKEVIYMVSAWAKDHGRVEIRHCWPV